MKTTSGRRNGRMTSWAHTIAAAGVAVLLLAPVASAGSWDKWVGRTKSDDFKWVGHVASGKAIELKGVNGSITAEATTGSEVEVEATKTAHKSDPTEVQIEVIEHADGVTICAVYPTPRGSRPNDCKPGEGGHMNTRNNDVNVEFRVRVPAGVRLVGRTVNGSITARGLRADTEAHTVNGSVEISTRGNANASTVNGSIEAELGTDLHQALEFATVNGGITLVVPASTGAEVRASTVNGAITTDLPVTATGRLNYRRLNGTIGRGGHQLMMTTVNGDIRLRSAS